MPTGPHLAPCSYLPASRLTQRTRPSPKGPRPSCGRTPDGLLLLSLPVEGPCVSSVSWATGLGLWRPAWQAVTWPVGRCVHHALTGMAVRKSCSGRLQRDSAWTWVKARLAPGQLPCLLLSQLFPKDVQTLRWSECDLSSWLPVLPFHLARVLRFQLAPSAPLPSDASAPLPSGSQCSPSV